jgi:hypothetical protein
MPLAACYSMQSVAAVPAPGSTVVLELNDRARVALGDRIGPSAASIEGIVQTGTDSVYVLRISSVQYLNGQSNRLSGEPVAVDRGFVGQAWQREFSRSRTTSLSLGLAAALFTLVRQAKFFSTGSGPIPGDPPPGGGKI